jgi:hypothetical protein|tara:strand:- start:178 stop:450 length:273 start_codon:yes stop_codon:yes gene_type:complete
VAVLNYEANALTFLEKREIFLEAVLLRKAPFDTPLEITEDAFFSVSSATALLLLFRASSSFFRVDLILVFRFAFLTLLTLFCLARFSADL